MTFFVVLLFSFFVVVLLLFCVYLMFAVFIGAPFLPTGKKYVAKMLDCAALRAGETFVDMGSGDGRFVIAAARRGARATGYEINPFLVLIARVRIWFTGLGDRATIHWQSFWGADLRGVDVVSVFGITGIMPRLEKKFVRELHPGARVVSYIFPLPNWKAVYHEDGIRVYKR